MEIKDQFVKMLNGLLVISLFICLHACQKESPNISDYQRPVVEGFLVPGNAVQVKVYYQKYLEDTISYGYPVTGLKMNISDGMKAVQLAETGPGIYTYPDVAFVKEHHTYVLSFTYRDKEISAKTTVPDKPVNFKESSSQQNVPGFSFGSTPKTFVPVIFSWDKQDAGYYLMVFKNIDQNPNSVNSGNTTAYKDSEVILGQVNSYQTQPLTFTYLGNYRVLLFHINKEYSDALNSFGGTSLNLTNPATNVVNGLGVFTAMRADTLSLLVYQ